MEMPIIEAQFPLDFRKEEAEELGKKLKHNYSMDLIGMRRVGISNFLRFFLYHKDIVKTYISPTQKHLFVPVDMNDLVEREIFPFWTLTLKRIVDAVEHSTYPVEIKTKVESLFLDSIQSQDLFLLIDNVRRALITIVEHEIAPTLFFLRFDRMKDNIPSSFFDNLKGLRDATDDKLTYIFTSYRSMDDLFPTARTALSVLSKSMYIKPAKQKDMEIIYNAYKKRHNFLFPNVLEQALFDLTGGNVQYLQLALVILHEKQDGEIKTQQNLFRMLVEDERIALQSEELWESLTSEEQKVLLKVNNGENISEQERTNAHYLWQTGFVRDANGKETLFTPLFTFFLENKVEGVGKSSIVHMTKKEHLLFTLLESHRGEICEREEIIEKVWPEYKEFGVSDWAIDRLVARVRVKLREQHSPYEVVTVRTRGYKLSVIKE